MTPIKAMGIHAGQRVTVTPLPDHQEEFGATILDRSGNVLFLKTSAPVYVGSAAEINAANVILLADVLSCRPVDGGYATGIVVEHALQEDKYLRRFWPEIKSASLVQNGTRQRIHTLSAEAKASALRMCVTVWCFTASLVLEVVSRVLALG